MSKKIKILVADDHQLFRKGLVSLVQNLGNFEIVGEANDGNEVIQILRQGVLPDLILLDLNMVPVNGIETLSILRKEKFNIPCLVLSMRKSNDPIYVKVVKAGANGFIFKNSSPEELKLAIETTADHQFYLGGEIYESIANLKHRSFKVGKAFVGELLDPQEFEFLKTICSELTYKEIAENLDMNPRQVDYMRALLFEKFGVKSRVGLALMAVKLGIFKI
jgi:DNA-binding NarL/FixJ family response regulator